MPKAISLPGYKSLREFSQAVGVSHRTAVEDMRRGYCLLGRGGEEHYFSHPLRVLYNGMLQRCYQPGAIKYALYGGRGIRVCGRWFYSFAAFVADMGDRPSPDHSLDRINGNGHYEPSNCRWATDTEQNNNRRAYLMKNATKRSLLGQKHISLRANGSFRVRFTTPIARSKSFQTLEEAIQWRDEQLTGMHSLLLKKNAS